MSYFIDWLQGGNTVCVSNEQEFNEFVKMLEGARVDEDMLRHLRKPWSYQQEIALLNLKKNDHFTGDLYFEMQPGKGISAYYDKRKSVDWYGIEPYKMSEM